MAAAVLRHRCAAGGTGRSAGPHGWTRSWTREEVERKMDSGRGIFGLRDDSSRHGDSAPQSIPIQTQVRRDRAGDARLAGSGGFVKERCSSGSAGREDRKPAVPGQTETVTRRAVAQEVRQAFARTGVADDRAEPQKPAQVRAQRQDDNHYRARPSLRIAFTIFATRESAAARRSWSSFSTVKVSTDHSRWLAFKSNRLLSRWMFWSMLP